MMTLADIFIEKFDLSDLESKCDENIWVLWQEIKTGLKSLKADEKLIDELKVLNYLALEAIATEVKNRNLSGKKENDLGSVFKGHLFFHGDIGSL
jgi:hypothetical protein